MSETSSEVAASEAASKSETMKRPLESPENTPAAKLLKVSSDGEVIIEMVNDGALMEHSEQGSKQESDDASSQDVVILQGEVAEEETVMTTDNASDDFSLDMIGDKHTQVQVVVEQEVSDDNLIPQIRSDPKPKKQKRSLSNTATVAAPQGVNPAMMSNLLHTAAAVAASQNAAAATVQVVPGQATGTIQLVPASEVQNTQTLMASGIAPQSLSPQTIGVGEDGKPQMIPQPTNQPVFTYLVTSQGTLISAHSSDGTPLISPAESEKNTNKAKSEEGDGDSGAGRALFINYRAITIML